jgi:hypothetical protein
MLLNPHQLNQPTRKYSMKSLVSTVLLAGILFGVCTTVIADTSDTATVEIWNCTLNDGKTMDDVAAANGKWVKFMNANVEGGDIHSYGQTAVVGEQGTFLYIDVFPDMKAWIASKAAIESEEGQALEAGLNEVASCSSNSLYSSTEH